MTDYDLVRAQCDLDTVKNDLRSYLEATYRKEGVDSTEKVADVFKYIKETVDKVIKRQSYSLKWGPNGTPQWHASILNYVSKWISLELEVSKHMKRLIESEQ